MKCVMCDGQLEEKLGKYKEFNIPLGEFKALVCSKCDEVYFDAKTVDEIQEESKKLGLFGLNSPTI